MITSDYQTRVLVVILFSLFFLPSMNAQKESRKFNVKGNISLGGFHYYDDLETNLRPFGASFMANARLSYGRFSIPLGVSINNQGTRFQQPFNRYGISPTYKWAKVHLGWRRMRFSKFTMTGLQFFGAGVELTPGLFQLSAMTGKIDYRIPGIPRELIDQLPDRKVIAGKLGLGSRRNNFNITVMKANDEVVGLDTLTKPKENVTIGTELKLSLFKNRLTFAVDGGLSVFTEDRNMGSELIGQLDVPRFASSILEPNNSTHINYAVESVLGFNLGVFSMKTIFRRVMPEYQSLGLNYLRNDVESLVFSPSIRLWSNKVNLSGSAI